MDILYSAWCHLKSVCVIRERWRWALRREALERLLEKSALDFGTEWAVDDCRTIFFFSRQAQEAPHRGTHTHNLEKFTGKCSCQTTVFLWNEEREGEKKSLMESRCRCLCLWRKRAMEPCERKSENLLKFPVSSSLLVLAAEKLKGLGRYSGNWKKNKKNNHPPFHLFFFSQAISFSFTF